jgi:hypothetical protein
MPPFTYFFKLAQPLKYFYSKVTVHCPYGLRNPYSHLKSENSQDYAPETSTKWDVHEFGFSSGAIQGRCCMHFADSAYSFACSALFCAQRTAGALYCSNVKFVGKCLKKRLAFMNYSNFLPVIEGLQNLG